MMKRRTFLYNCSGYVAVGLAAMLSLGFIAPDEKENEAYKIIKVRCNGCKHCLMSCKQKAITILEGKATIDPGKCKGCGDCVRSCRRQAIAQESGD